MLTFICISAPWLKRTTTNNKIKNPTTKHYYVFVYALIIIMNVNIVAVMLLVGFISIRICSTATTFAIDLMVIHSTFRFFSPFTLFANKFTKINMHQSSQNLQVCLSVFMQIETDAQQANAHRQNLIEIFRSFYVYTFIHYRIFAVFLFPIFTSSHLVFMLIHTEWTIVKLLKNCFFSLVIHFMEEVLPQWNVN